MKNEQISSILKHIHSIYHHYLQPPSPTCNTTITNRQTTLTDDSLTPQQPFSFQETQQILNRLQKELESYRRKMSAGLEDMVNFLQNFQIMSTQLMSCTSLMRKSYAYSMQHVIHMTENMWKEAQVRKEGKERIWELIDEINKKLQKDQIYERKQRGYSDRQVHQLIQKTRIQEEQIRKYEYERISFMRLQQYYENEISSLHSKDPLPTFNYNFQSKEKKPERKFKSVKKLKLKF